MNITMYECIKFFTQHKTEIFIEFTCCIFCTYLIKISYLLDICMFLTLNLKIILQYINNIF